MNKHVELVKKWLADPESVSKEELEDNRKAARAAYEAAESAYCAAARAAYEAALDAFRAADDADDALDAWAADDARAAESAYWAAADAAYWVKRYEELTNE